MYSLFFNQLYLLSYIIVVVIMYPVIGIISRKSKSEKGHDISYIYNDIVSAVIKSKGIPIGITSDNIDLYLDICDGFILQGGDDIMKEDLDMINKLYKLDIPLLGICLGMQEMGYAFDGEIIDVDNHIDNKLHDIVINNDSILYKIFNCERTIVNSRHKSAIKNSSLFVSAKSGDGVTEAIEDKNKKFFVGVQWHPENMINSDILSRRLFDYFIEICMKK